METNLLDKSYEPHGVEQRWYHFWEEQGLFRANQVTNRPAYSIVIPPPNVTGVLHMGHALNNTLQDILCRYRRLQGDNVLWMPGTDHAGIATQNVVEKKLAEQGITRHQIGREKFIEAVWEWRKTYGNAIINQLKRLGASCDWEKERFTMDEGLSKAVRKVFVQLFNEGLIYQGTYIINWCPRCHTALADLEVEHETHEGQLYYIWYPYANHPDKQGIVVATTRPETMFGDTAVAVNPDDIRYQDIPEQHVKLPLTHRIIPIIRDSYVDMRFGTGALKITPAHDPNDYEIGKRYQLESIKVIDDKGVMLSSAGHFQGMDRFACRQAAIKALTEQGLLVKVEPYQHNIGHCYRCKNIVEPNLSKQWFVRVKPLADKAIKAVEEKQTLIIPEIWTKTYFEWMYNIKDWCISRQIWWGHQIPAWKCKECGELIVAMDSPKTCTRCNSSDIEQETDVLDTWFSSALWPFSTMGWPDKTQLLETFYPTSVLVTGFDILFFWVARMMMMGIHFMGSVPFKDVYVHALVRDEHGSKMSKSKGNVIDPLTVIEKYGTDSFRFTLASLAAQGRDIKLSLERVDGYRHFINKLWNASRFSLIYLQKGYEDVHIRQNQIIDQWILIQLSKLIGHVKDSLNTYRFNDAANGLYQFIWHEFCDWYLEAIKPVLYERYGQEAKEATLSVLFRALHDSLILLHPFIPFVTEEIWHKLPGTKGSIMTAPFPTAISYNADHVIEIEKQMECIMSIINGIRNIRGEMNISPSLDLIVSLQTADDFVKQTSANHKDMIIYLAKLKAFTIEAPGLKPKSSAAAVIKHAEIFISLEGIIDVEKETARLEKELTKLSRELEGLSKKLANQDFLEKAPVDVIQKNKEKCQIMSDKKDKISTHLSKLKDWLS
ncbi:MAG: valine--tRNA ligase [Desulfobacterales bacterium]|nr:valine--tRNA ligase [Desulfobacterales bacterium]